MVLVSILVPFHNPIFLNWCNYQLRKSIKYCEDKCISIELIICSELSKDLFNDFPVMSFISCNQGELIGVKRNKLLKKAIGRYVAYYDSDDFYMNYRIEYQLKAIIHHKTDITTTNRLFCYNITENRSYYVTCEAEGCLFFKRKIGTQFGSKQIGEGLELAKGKSIYFENDYLLMIALQHSQNTSLKNTDVNLGDINEYLNETEKRLLEVFK